VRRGARSIRGSLGAYLVASSLALAALALALWLGWPPAGSGARDGVELAPGSPWTEAALDDGRRQFSLSPGQRVAVPPGEYRLTLRTADGRIESRTIEVGAGGTQLH